MTATLLLAALVGAVLHALARSAPDPGSPTPANASAAAAADRVHRPGPGCGDGVVAVLVAGLRELARLDAPRRERWQHGLRELQRPWR